MRILSTSGLMSSALPWQNHWQQEGSRFFGSTTESPAGQVTMPIRHLVLPALEVLHRLSAQTEVGYSAAAPTLSNTA